MFLFTVQCSDCEKVLSTSVSTNHTHITPKVGTGGVGGGGIDCTLSKISLLGESIEECIKETFRQVHLTGSEQY